MVRKEFRVHLLNEGGIKIATEMAQKFSDLSDWVESVSEASPEFKKFLDQLELASFYAKKSMAQKKENQKA